MLGFRGGWAVAWPAVAAVAPAFAGCTDFATVTPNVCGNGVVEEHEDCDQTDSKTSGNACGQPGKTGECQFSCTYGGSKKCPSGFACGEDDICRKPIAQKWTAALPVTASPANDILVADFDGDGLDDVAAVTSSSIDVHYFETSRTSTATAQILADSSHPAAGVLMETASSFPSLTLALSDGITVFTGGSGRTLTATPFASESFSGVFHASPFVYDMQSTDGAPPSSVTDFYVYNDKSITVAGPPPLSNVTLKYTKGETRTGTGVVARFNALQGCGQLAIPFNRALGGHVEIWSPCVAAGGPGPTSLNGTGDVSLPPGLLTATDGQPLFLADVDFDGHLDLVIVDTDHQLHVAFSNGIGGFASSPIGLPNSMAGDALQMVATASDGTKVQLPSSPPLAVGDLNGDCALDFVDSTNIWVSYFVKPPKGPCSALATLPQPDGYVSYTHPDGPPWSGAHVADMNADGIPDVVVTPGGVPSITLYRGTSTAFFNPVDIPTSAPVNSIAIGDFDGDLVNDIVFAETGPVEPGTTLTRDSVAVSFGTRSGPPGDPVIIGQIDSVEEILPATEQVVYKDVILNPFVAAFDGTSTDIYLFAGSSSRQLVAPYLFLQGSTIPDSPLRSAIGSFTTTTGSTTKALLAGLAVYAKPPMCSAASCSSHLWLLPVDAEGNIPIANDLSTPPALAGTFGASDDALIANLGAPYGGQTDQIVIAAPAASGTADVSLVVMEGTSGGEFQASSPELDVTGLDTSGLGTGSVQLLTADVDGSGRKAAVLVSTVMPTAQDSNPIGHLLVALWDGTKLQALPLLDTTALFESCTMASGAVQSLRAAALTLEPDGKKQGLVVVSPAAAVLVEYASGALTSKCLTIAGTQPGMQGMQGVLGGSAVGVGDFDGDAIPDIVVSQGDGLVVYYGLSYKPGGS